MVYPLRIHSGNHTATRWQPVVRAILTAMKKNEVAVGKVRAYREKGLSFREIARLMKADIKSVYRWYRYSLTDSVGSSPVGVVD